MNKVLFVESSEVSQDGTMSTCYPLKCSKIREHYDYCDVSKNLEVDMSKYEKVLFGCRAIYFYKIYRNKLREKLKENFEKLMSIPNRYIIIQDSLDRTYGGNLNEFCEVINKYNFNIIFTYYNCIQTKNIIKSTPNCKHFHLPHHINTNIFKKYENVEKTIDILLFGSIHPRHYPLRKRLFDLILQNKETLGNVVLIEKPASFDPNFCEDGLCKLLNQSKYSISTTTRYGWFVGKYYEIFSSNCLVMGNISNDADNITKNSIVELNEKMSDEEIINKIKYHINNFESNKGKLDTIQKHIMKEYNLDKYIERLNKILSI